MENYLESICIFICLGDLLANFLPSVKFEKLYRYIFGMFVMLVIIQPLGKSIAELLDENESGLRTEFEQRIAQQNDLWDVSSDDGIIREQTEKLTEAYLGQWSEDEMQKELADYGYQIEGEE